MPKRKSTQPEAPIADSVLRRSPRNQMTEVGVRTAATELKPSPRNPTSRFKKETEPPAKKSRSTEKTANSSIEKPKANGNVAAADTSTATAEQGERDYWLLKAEPEPRFENGVDVSFSIDDLAARTEPEPWDGKLTHVDLEMKPMIFPTDTQQESARMQPATTSVP